MVKYSKTTHLWRGLLLAAAAFTLLVVSSPTYAAISGSSHDLRTVLSITEICVVCHTPHFSDTTVADSPLWNHEVTAQTYTVYNSGTMDAVDAGSQPSGISKLCLSCHDGTVALDSYGGASGSVFIDAAYDVDDVDSLTNDHPVSITFDDALAATDGELHTPSTDPSNVTGGTTIQDDLLFGTANDKLECGSCHDVHNGPEVGVKPSLLRIDPAASLICLTCHDK